MKWGLLIVLLAGAGIVAFGLPGRTPLAQRETLFASGTATLAMTFAHSAHETIICTQCHHEFTDGTVGPTCMSCHNSDPAVAPWLEQQFHDLCRGCHIEQQAQGLTSGPTRVCTACHVPDDDF